jgi:hypothetical protein
MNEPITEDRINKLEKAMDNLLNHFESNLQNRDFLRNSVNIFDRDKRMSLEGAFTEFRKGIKDRSLGVDKYNMALSNAMSYVCMLALYKYSILTRAEIVEVMNHREYLRDHLNEMAPIIKYKEPGMYSVLFSSKSIPEDKDNGLQIETVWFNEYGTLDPQKFIETDNYDLMIKFESEVDVDRYIFQGRRLGKSATVAVVEKTLKQHNGEIEMATVAENKLVENIVFIGGVRATQLCTEQLYALIKNHEAQIASLGAMTTKPKTAVKQITKLEQDIKDLIAYMDGLVEDAPSTK